MNLLRPSNSRVIMRHEVLVVNMATICYRVPDSLLAKLEKYKPVKYTFKCCFLFFETKHQLYWNKGSRFTLFLTCNLSTCPTFLFHDKGAVWVELLGTNQNMFGTFQLYGGIKWIFLESIISTFWINKDSPVFEQKQAQSLRNFHYTGSFHNKICNLNTPYSQW